MTTDNREVFYALQIGRHRYSVYRIEGSELRPVWAQYEPFKGGRKLDAKYCDGSKQTYFLPPLMVYSTRRNMPAFHFHVDSNAAEELATSLEVLYRKPCRVELLMGACPTPNF